MVDDEEWFRRLGWEVSVTEVEPGVYEADIWPARNPRLRLPRVARGVLPEIAVRHAREFSEESLAARQPLSRHCQYPLTIVMTRYGGTYEGGTWAAFPLYPDGIPPEATGEDLECADWWEHPSVAAGVGATPDIALAALDEVIEQCVHPSEARSEIGQDWICQYCQKYEHNSQKT